MVTIWAKRHGRLKIESGYPGVGNCLSYMNINEDEIIMVKAKA